MIKAVIFDLDGLLADTEIVSYKIYQDMLAKYQVSFSIEYYAQNYSGKSEKHNLTNIIEQFSLPLSLEDGFKYVEKREMELLEKGITLKPGAKELLQYLIANHYKIGLATSSKKERAEKILKMNDIYQYFDSLTYTNEVKNGKPHPDIFLKASEKLCVYPNECLVLEDSEAGIEAGYRANMCVINIPDMKKPSEQYRKMVIEQYDTLLDVIPYLENSKAK
ncbi:hypothetical protein QV09_06380 [Gallibacterium salpingitidis]|uniref:Phosphatase n=1 Tax=Gallibacterium salpingitidis TaxID=505341 RepID=A0AB36E2E5_9PAST|nr:HAD family phosphatase [Gallibacterium salpingitidis]OBX10291.1 hypothetical protein QV09_06380 [Gallibacterium salpingitidis]